MRSMPTRLHSDYRALLMKSWMQPSSASARSLTSAESTSCRFLTKMKSSLLSWSLLSRSFIHISGYASGGAIFAGIPASCFYDQTPSDDPFADLPELIEAPDNPNAAMPNSDQTSNKHLACNCNTNPRKARVVKSTPLSTSKTYPFTLTKRAVFHLLSS